MTKENNQIMNLASEILAQFFYKEYNAGKKEIIIENIINNYSLSSSSFDRLRFLRFIEKLFTLVSKRIFKKHFLISLGQFHKDPVAFVRKSYCHVAKQLGLLVDSVDEKM
jgi:hypothetical protein